MGLISSYVLQKRNRRKRAVDDIWASKLRDDMRFRKKWSKTEVQLIVTRNAFHSPEESMDECDENGNRKIRVVDLFWRSSKV